MKRFKFSLEKVLRYKKLLKEQKQAALFKAYREYFEHRQELERLERLLDEGRETLLCGSLSPSMMLHRTTYVELMAQRVSSQIAVTEAARQQIIECRRMLIEAEKEQQVLEKLKERKREEYQHWVEAQLQTELDEVASSAFARRS